MLILPVPRAPDWRRRPPWMTLLLIISCTFIFFVLQGKDEQRTEAAWTYYLQSDLPDIELPLYVRYQNQHGKSDVRLPEAPDEVAVMVQQLQYDPGFQRALKSGQLFPPSGLAPEGWQAARKQFETMLARSVTDHYGFVPAQPRAVTWFSHMFLHGSADHLFGNMVVLFIVGYLVEEALGAGLFLLCYLLAGLGANALDLALHSERLVVGVGASGAISGVMAMFVVLFGLQRIRFLYWVVVYLDFFMAPALLVLPVWMANEAYQMWVDKDGMINNTAHLGGFAAGAVLAGLYRLSRRKDEQPVVLDAGPSEAEQLAAQLHKVHLLLADLAFDRARTLLRPLVQQHPQQAELLQAYYQASRWQGDSEDYHLATGRLLAWNALPVEQAREVLNHYLTNARPVPRLSASLMANLGKRLLQAGFLPEGVRLCRALLARDRQHRALPALLLLVARASREQGDTAHAQLALTLLRQHFPGSAEDQLSAQW
ncbi:rhomboid family intramembrane serine protease [Leeia aquatica]|uniref:Rhomboid family intramembrane serine protease n=1 Tax=Leeia aquatica TaxID=2725557 RepID=A0A847SGD7_9NEIS|nr:rhomboid family intramembrane serine protease [Leeia aquatica]NLR76279.1 rhomboid family intramembrane serine protease [Leeia aquatica]